MKIKLTRDKDGLLVLKDEGKEYRFIMSFPPIPSELGSNREMLSTALDTLQLGDEIEIEFPKHCRLCARRMVKNAF